MENLSVLVFLKAGKLENIFFFGKREVDSSRVLYWTIGSSTQMWLNLIPAGMLSIKSYMMQERGLHLLQDYIKPW